MRLPDNRLVADGRDLATYYGLVMSDEHTLSPPERKTYMVEVPGGNGFIDLAEAVNGDAVFSQRKMEFLFAVISPKTRAFTLSRKEFEQTKTQVSNWLHGMRRKFTLSFDPGYTYTGRFDVSEYYSEQDGMHYIKVEVTCDPYKFKETKQYVCSSYTSRTYAFESGRKPVRPIVRVQRNTEIVWKGQTFQVPKGTWRLSNVVFTEGLNYLSFGTWSEGRLTWDKANSMKFKWSGWREQVWDYWKTYKYRTTSVSKDATGTIGVDANGNTVVVRTWGDMERNRWSAFNKTKRWETGVNQAIGDNAGRVDVAYDWSDL